jgi:hypothetical protein
MKAFKIIILLSFLIVAAASHADAQRRKLNPMNTVYGEFYLISPDQTYGVPGVSYERLFSPKQTYSIRIGALMPSPEVRILVIPVTVQGYTASGRQHHIDYGGGLGPMLDYYDEFKTSFYVQLLGGYRYSKGTGLVFRATANMIVHPEFFLSPTVSVGYMF